MILECKLENLCFSAKIPGNNTFLKIIGSVIFSCENLNCINYKVFLGKYIIPLDTLALWEFCSWQALKSYLLRLLTKVFHGMYNKIRAVLWSPINNLCIISYFYHNGLYFRFSYHLNHCYNWTGIKLHWQLFILNGKTFPSVVELKWPKL